MEQQSKRPFYSPYSSKDPTMEASVSAGQGTIYSPYLNFDPAYIQGADSDYIYPEGANRQRGRLELSFFRIGGSVMAGGAVGGLSGAFSVVRDNRGTGLTYRRFGSEIINSVAKRGASSAQSFGVIALLYSMFGVGFTWVPWVNDDCNTVVSAGLTGALYGSSGGRWNAGKGLGIGLGLATTYCLFSNYVLPKWKLGQN